MCKTQIHEMRKLAKNRKPKNRLISLFRSYGKKQENVISFFAITPNFFVIKANVYSLERKFTSAGSIKQFICIHEIFSVFMSSSYIPTVFLFIPHF